VRACPGYVLLALDLGATGCKAIAGILCEDDTLRMEEICRFPNYMVRLDDSLYWDVLGIWQRIKEAIKAAVKKYGAKLVSIGLDTWGVDYALLDSRGELIGNPHTYRDPRTEGLLEEVLGILGKEYIYERTGIQFIRINTLYQLYSMARSRSPQLAAASTFLMIPDLFNYWLTGHKACEYTEASTTQFVDPRVRRWCMDILERLGIPTHIFPEIVAPATPLGSLKSGVAGEVGAPRELMVVAPATHDTASAIAAGPFVGEETGYISSGTWSLVGVELREPLINRQAMEFNFTNEGGAFNTITFLRNVQGMWLLEEVRRILAEGGESYTYAELIEAASRARPFKAFIDPDAPQLLAPANMIEEIRRLIVDTKQEPPSSIGELVRAIFESLALKYRLVLEQAARLTGRRMRSVNIFGGASRNWLLNQLTADFTGLTVYAGPDEATSIGNVLLQAAGLGWVSSLNEMREIVRNSFEIKVYEPNHTAEHDEAYDRFLAVTQAQE